MIQFIIEPSWQPTRGRLFYDRGDYSFGFEPRPEAADASVVVNTLELMVDRSTSRLVFVEGYCPHVGWMWKELAVPQYRRAGLRVDGHELQRGGAVALESSDALWPAFQDETAGWVMLSRPDAQDAGQCMAVEFADGCVAELHESRLVSLWLKPETRR